MDVILPRRKSLRMKGYDYTQAGGYFVTVATYKHSCLLGEIQNGEMRLNSTGKIVEEMLGRLPGRFNGLVLDEYVIMPDHVHLIVIIEDVPGGHRPELGEVIRTFKAGVSLRRNRLPLRGSGNLWQRNYYEHIIRDERDLDSCREYIWNNVAAWDEEH